MDIQLGLERLNAQLPLKARQEQLPLVLKVLHQKILTSLLVRGRVPTEAEFGEVLGEADTVDALRRLADDDLVVLDPAGNRVLGAYPMTLAQTAHRITVSGNTLFAMCALDAMAIAPMFNAGVLIESSCHLRHSPVVIRMHGSRIINSQPATDVRVGIRWQMPSTVAAHSMCLDMVFLGDPQSAATWQDSDRENRSLYTLAEAVAIGQAFFTPLMD